MNQITGINKRYYSRHQTPEPLLFQVASPLHNSDMATIFGGPKVAGYATAFGVTELNDTDKGEYFVDCRTYASNMWPVAMTIPCLPYVGQGK